ncbi:hypothetical protein C2S52_021246 [Perilla frutescens var. hirtella]|uniref:Uncharacterized protein n=1 Tax=Perilla frutescens var. hirtella TaxID=608512 RepID=A0AAD4JJS4_PERFH|nr:hypothetical protein C2S52_021246 [Perilla frutescens var. hirtella]KAH6799499.1 hypothetical protein C2S51_035983 [Perilla frutescens var. frutescens]KAH6808207.1 hypothetical protein C2S51_029315 [Perilla frutescens var. frutescens]KAH6835138.1 hypothetical protein C2S53_003623 [Perilla frutescens var. hirtella]
MVNIVENMKKGLVNLVEIVSCGSRGAKANDGEAPKLKVATKLQASTARGAPTGEKPSDSNIEST